MAMTEFITAFLNKEVDVYCGGKSWFHGKVQKCSQGVVTLLANEGTVHVNTDKILSVSPRVVCDKQ